MVKGIETAVCYCHLPITRCLCCLHPWHTSKWLYLSHTIAGIGYQLQVLEDIIRLEFFPALTGHSPPNNTNQKLMSLLAKLRGLRIADPSLTSEYKFNASVRVTAPLRKLIKEQDHEYFYEALANQMMENQI